MTKAEVPNKLDEVQTPEESEEKVQEESPTAVAADTAPRKSIKKEKAAAEVRKSDRVTPSKVKPAKKAGGGMFPKMTQQQKLEQLNKQQEAKEKEKEEAEAKEEQRQEAVSNHSETLDEMQDQVEKMEETLTKVQDE